MTKQPTRQELIDDTLRKMHAVVPGIKASVVVNRDGLLVAAYPPTEDDDYLANPTSSPQVAAMAATLISLAERTLGRLEQGDLARLLMEGEDGVMVVYPAGRATLAVLVDKEQRMSPVLYAAGRTSEDIAKVLAG
ncbi:MAG TPA: roadblock/LC7 domain-containing protein [Aggregatilineales bacterium]|nr:roadblock/LC7 domain-containing protein [Anaerolineales bacterium]HRE47630.1 roadblock/LC7 domain-containing protein [Aggregatilineales bacterium]